MEQVFSPHPYPASLRAHVQTGPLYTDMRLTELAEVQRGPPSWALGAYARAAGDKGKLAALDLQVRLGPGAGRGHPASPGGLPVLHSALGQPRRLLAPAIAVPGTGSPICSGAGSRTASRPRAVAPRRRAGAGSPTCR